MKLSEQLKKYRKQRNLTQLELAQKLNVSDKTISSWENDRTYPDISLLLNLSSILDVSLDEFLKGDVKTVEKIDSDLHKKKIYRNWLVGIVGVLAILVGGFSFFHFYQYQNENVDRINPLMKYETGYTVVPTYEEMEKRKMKMPFKNMLVIDDAWGKASILNFYGGLPPKDKHYAMVLHKGSYVKNMTFITWGMIPKLYQNNMLKNYDDMQATTKSIIKNDQDARKSFIFQNRDYE